MNTLPKPVQESRAKLARFFQRHHSPELTRGKMIAIGLVSVPIIVGSCFITQFIAGLPTPELNKGLVVHDRSGKIICTVYDEGVIAETVTLGQISPHLKKAVLAAEDGNFYSHNGVDFSGVVRAAVTDISTRKAKQGASTITQQLVKNLYYSDKPRNFLQKIKEVIVAVQFEEKFPKDRILAEYLNTIYFGQGAYGIERAAKTYFGKSASNLNLAESTSIAALITTPSVFGQVSHRKELLNRQHQIIDEMVADKTITKEAGDAAKKAKLKFRSFPAPTPAYMSFLDVVKNQLVRDTKVEYPWRKGMHVYTTLDQAAQRLAMQELTAGIMKAPHGVTQGALVSLSVRDGSIIALVGGGGSGNASSSQFNRATAPHTAGSAFKPFVYLTALEQKALVSDSIVLDGPFENAGYDPTNFDGRYMGWMSIRRALALSRNTCAVRILGLVGPEKVAETAARAGITSKMDATPALALGSCAASPLDMANAYATMVRNGARIQPSLISYVTDSHEKIVFQTKLEEKNVISSEACAQMVDLMQDVVQSGTGKRAQLFNRPVGGKTGTSDGARDLWFVGFTPDTVTAVWMGNDHNKPIAGLATTGGTVAASVWKSYMQKYYTGHPTPAGSFTPPQTPLIEEPPAGEFMFDRPSLFEESGEVMSEIVNGDENAPRVVEYNYLPSPREAREGTRRSSELEFDKHEEKMEKKREKKKTSKIKKLFRKLSDWF